MADLLKTWLQAQLGVIMDLTPEIFGRHTRDGTLIAQILHNYDVISSNQLSMIVRTYDPALSRVNLKILQIWLKLINVTLSDQCIEKISKVKGAAALELFYKVYFSLEGKDRLDFIVLQKERKKLASASSKFRITKIREESPIYQPPEHPLSKPLIEATDTILWYRDKFWSILQACKNERRRFEDEMKYFTIPVEYFPNDVENEAKEESERLDEFALKYPACKTQKKKLVECCPQKKYFDVTSVEDPAIATKYVDFLKKRSKRAAKFHDSKLKTQTTMIVDAWEKLLKQQDKSFDEALGLRVLNQSQYEKQIMRKLCEVRDMRNRVVENLKIVDTMLLKIQENEQRLQERREQEAAAAEARDVEMEVRRMRELHQRIHEEKVRRFREMQRGICLEVVRDLADVAVKIAEYRQADDDGVPRSIWSDCRTLFLKNQPIFEFAEYSDFLEVADAEGVEEEDTRKKAEDEETRSHEIMIKDGNDPKNGETKDTRRTDNGKEEKVVDKQKLELLQLELDRQRVLADADFENYRDLASPWDEFVPTRKEGQEEDEAEEVSRLGCVVLGYVAHRLLRMLHKLPTEITTPSMPKVKVAAIVLGVTSTALLDELRELLKKCDVHLLQMEDAIDHCLEKYKREMADVEYIDLDIVSARDVRRSDGKTNGPKNRRVKLPEQATVKNTVVTQRQNVEEKQTQTPRQIPYDDLHPTLSNAAYIGKWTYEFLTLGQSISNELNTKILMEYLKGIESVEGWALINYPNTYKQMAMLEEALTGYRMPPDRNNVLDLASIEDIEDIDPQSPRIVFDSDEVDTYAMCRQSRLLPDPISKEKDRPSSFVTVYIKAMPKPKTLSNQDICCIPLPDDATSMDEYYADQNIAHGFYYNILDLSSMKQLAKLITGERLTGRESPLDLLDEVPQEQEPPTDPEAAIIKRWVLKSKWEKLQRDQVGNSETVNRDSPAVAETQLARFPVRPGEYGWQWMDFPQSPLLLETLAMLWESMEDGYVENLKEIFSLKRIHTSAIIPYKELVLRNLRNFIDRPDNRQNLLQDFHRAFNEIDKDLREDIDMKCELHCRVVDFRAELWELCDARRHEAENERKRILRNQWVPVETAVLVNVYIEILQTESDRFVDTVQLLQDYYTSMSQKPLQESRFSKILLDRVELDRDFRETSNSETTDEPINDKEKETTTKTKTDSVDAFTRTTHIKHFKTDIESLLTNASRTFDPERNVVYDVIKDTIRQVRSAVDSTSSTIMETLKKEEKAAVLSAESKNKVGKITSASPNSILIKLEKRSRDLVEEWRYAIRFEIDRIRRRLDVLDAAARSDVAFLLDTMRRTFHRLHDRIVERLIPLIT
ncbi:PREDICTED: sperm flagellar protein 2-like [Dinoponera quadriceps]|uniref:Sperm flagellar protein 2-like n=1 Tax=Dinoponera quadriceps TaxID=609295 RepID=A0A6P3XVL3_DINQU|nr:PREDICTED: sperm flagellar protein 2-like [Dinoponera quadriceps]